MLLVLEDFRRHAGSAASARTGIAASALQPQVPRSRRRNIAFCAIGHIAPFIAFFRYRQPLPMIQALAAERDVCPLQEGLRGLPPGRNAGGPMDDALKRAKRYRLRAEECRTAADGMRHQLNRATLLRIAGDYDLLADSTERRAQGVRDRKTPTG